jgi:flavin reductase (DIM6/NTAB) family NADH-FMN oxidoreductase RutF
MELIDDFIAGMRRLASGVTVVTAAAADGTPCGMTATAVFSLSVDPPSLVVGVNKASRLGEILPDTANFAVSILGKRHRHIAEAFAGKVAGLWGPARFAYGKWHYNGEGVPILQDAPACLVCKVDDIIERPTHLLLIGIVTNIHLADQDAALLVHFARRFSGVDAPGVARCPLNSAGP